MANVIKRMSVQECREIAEAVMLRACYGCRMESHPIYRDMPKLEAALNSLPADFVKKYGERTAYLCYLFTYLVKSWGYEITDQEVQDYPFAGDLIFWNYVKPAFIMGKTTTAELARNDGVYTTPRVVPIPAPDDNTNDAVVYVEPTPAPAPENNRATSNDAIIDVTPTPVNAQTQNIPLLTTAGTQKDNKPPMDKDQVMSDIAGCTMTAVTGLLKLIENDPDKADLAKRLKRISREMKDAFKAPVAACSSSPVTTVEPAAADDSTKSKDGDSDKKKEKKKKFTLNDFLKILSEAGYTTSTAKCKNMGAKTASVVYVANKDDTNKLVFIADMDGEIYSPVPKIIKLSAAKMPEAIIQATADNVRNFISGEAWTSCFEPVILDMMNNGRIPIELFTRGQCMFRPRNQKTLATFMMTEFGLEILRQGAYYPQSPFAVISAAEKDGKLVISDAAGKTIAEISEDKENDVLNITVRDSLRQELGLPNPAQQTA